MAHFSQNFGQMGAWSKRIDSQRRFFVSLADIKFYGVARFRFAGLL